MLPCNHIIMLCFFRMGENGGVLLSTEHGCYVKPGLHHDFRRKDLSTVLIELYIRYGMLFTNIT